jgi:phage shock protein E
MKYLFVTTICFVSFMLFSCKDVSAQEGIKTVSANEFEKLIKGKDSIQLIDVRTPEEFKTSHIANSKNMNVLSETFLKDIEQLDKQKPVYIYCRSGKRSAKGASLMFEAGFVEIYNLDGGVLHWLSEGFNLLNP